MTAPLRIFILVILAIMLGVGLLVGVSFAAYKLSGRTPPNLSRSARVLAYLRDPDSHSKWSLQAGQQCDGAPFLFPTGGFIGFLWGDSFRPGHSHQGIDIFGGTEGKVTPVVAAASGYLTRLPDWKSSVIIRLPSDPLNPDRQIWTYYTHMAGPQGDSYIVPDFPPGSAEVYVEAGTLLGYQGNYSGNLLNPVGVHLHFSIVRDDGQGGFRNELEISNTIDPSAYFGLPLNAGQNEDVIPNCNF